MVFLGGKKFALILISLALLVGLGAGYFYYSRRLGQQDEEDATAGEEPQRVSEGPLVYGKIGSDEYLIAVVGTISEVGSEGVKITDGLGEDYFVFAVDIKKIPVMKMEMVTFDGEDRRVPSPSSETLKYEDLAVGMYVSFSFDLGELAVFELE